MKEKTCRFSIDNRIRREARAPGSTTWLRSGLRQLQPETEKATPDRRIMAP